MSFDRLKNVAFLTGIVASSPAHAGDPSMVPLAAVSAGRETASEVSNIDIAEPNAEKHVIQVTIDSQAKAFLAQWTGSSEGRRLQDSKGKEVGYVLPISLEQSLQFGQTVLFVNITAHEMGTQGSAKTTQWMEIDVTYIDGSKGSATIMNGKMLINSLH